MLLSLISWNWKRPDWPDFSYDAGAMTALETAFLAEVGEVAGAFDVVGEQPVGPGTLLAQRDEGRPGTALIGTERTVGVIVGFLRRLGIRLLGSGGLGSGWHGV